MASSELLCSLPDGLRLFHCASSDVIACLESLWQNAEFASTHLMRPRHCSDVPYCSQMKKVEKEWLHIANASSCGMTVVSSRSKHLNAELGAFAARPFKRRDVTGL